MIVDPDMPDHWKTRMLADLLNDELAPVYLLRLWGHCQNRKKSIFDKLPPAAVKAICRYQGDPNDLESALTECGFVHRDDDGTLEVVGWAEHNANLWSAWENGKKGGRPKKPTENPPDTPEKPNENPPDTGRSPDEGDEGDEGEKPQGGTPDGDTPCPHQEIVRLYHEMCPALPRVVKLNDARRDSLRARWKSDLKNLDQWEAYFRVVSESKFLTGRIDPSPGRQRPFMADFDFLIRPSSVIKVMEGKYDD